MLGHLRFGVRRIESTGTFGVLTAEIVIVDNVHLFFTSGISELITELRAREGSHSGSHEEFCIQGCNDVNPIRTLAVFRSSILPLSSGPKSGSST